MLKLIFWSLLAANAALVAVHAVNLSSATPTTTHQPKLLQPEKLTIVNASQAENPPSRDTASAESASTAPASVPEPKKVMACMEIGPFVPDEAKRFESRLASLSLGDRQSRRSVQEVASHIVFIPSQGSKEGAERKAGELQRLGINDFYIIRDDSNMRWGISLGVFKTEQAARNHLVNLNRQGVRSAQIGTRSVTSNKTVYQLRDLDEDALRSVEKIRADFSGQDMRPCK